MRAYSLHNLICPIPFGDDEEYSKYASHISGLKEALLKFVHHLGIHRHEARELAAAMLQVTADYPERVYALTTLPREHKNRLESIAVKLHVPVG